MARVASLNATRKLDERMLIIAHLQQLLNARRGQSPIAEDYGVIDMADLVHAFPDSLNQLQNSIRDTILKFEPRLKNVRVRQRQVEGVILLLHFEITAQLAKAGSRGVMRFRTEVNSAGGFKVR